MSDFRNARKNNVIRAARALRDATANILLGELYAQQAWGRLDQALRDHDDAAVAAVAKDEPEYLPREIPNTTFDAPPEKAADGETKGEE